MDSRGYHPTLFRISGIRQPKLAYEPFTLYGEVFKLLWLTSVYGIQSYNTSSENKFSIGLSSWQFIRHYYANHYLFSIPALNEMFHFRAFPIR